MIIDDLELQALQIVDQMPETVFSLFLTKISELDAKLDLEYLNRLHYTYVGLKRAKAKALKNLEFRDFLNDKRELNCFDFNKYINNIHLTYNPLIKTARKNYYVGKQHYQSKYYPSSQHNADCSCRSCKCINSID